jgi:YnbE-like lipoprotein
MEQKMLLKKSLVLKGSVAIGAILAFGACTPTVKVAVPDKPIEINLNINMKIEHNLRVQMEKDLEKAAKENPGIF